MGMEFGWKKWIRKHTFSIRAPLAAGMLLIGIVPVLVQSGIIIRAVRQNEINALSSKVQSQCLILSNKLTRSGYLEMESRDPLLDAEMSNLADILNGRIVIVDKNFKIVRDTFALSEGRTHVAEEVIRCFQGENSSSHNREKHFIAQTVPIYDGTPVNGIKGVIVMTSSTEPALEMADEIADTSRLYQLLIILALILLVPFLVRCLVGPFKRLQIVLNKVANGALEEDITADTYTETRNISEAVQRTLTKLKAADQSREEFVSNVSHELKTPITSIRVLADSLMSMKDVPAELYQEFMLDISDEIDRESKIIDDLLSMVKMDRSLANMNITQVNINDLLELILKRLRPIAQRRNIELIFESIRDVTADVDETKLSLAVTNLVENAIKYNIDEGWVRVVLDADHKFFYIRVIDSGIGIPEEYHEQVFERFYRVDKARSRETGGTGLGLSITRNAVLMHHGNLNLQSSEGQGTTFIVQIPLNYIKQ